MKSATFRRETDGRASQDDPLLLLTRFIWFDPTLEISARKINCLQIIDFTGFDTALGC
ncbi:hypothetical protein [Pseudoruegeria sp. HB172150]|uniref:hypothetical protein n=1 Tax=Pseudoruegeria sp. HB172150 TaxID=2721164 RepID=UPI001C1311DD|nr:hypothetical protein [Pseudoruegeria sp. HB172150]